MACWQHQRPCSPVRQVSTCVQEFEQCCPRPVELCAALLMKQLSVWRTAILACLVLHCRWLVTRGEFGADEYSAGNITHHPAVKVRVQWHVRHASPGGAHHKDTAPHLQSDMLAAD
jgi:hypothetical protein